MTFETQTVSTTTHDTSSPTTADSGTVTASDIAIPHTFAGIVPTKGGKGGNLDPQPAPTAPASPPLPPLIAPAATNDDAANVPHDNSEPDSRTVVRVKRGSLHEAALAAEQLLAASGKYYHAAGQIVTIQSDALTGDATIEPVSDPSLSLALSELARWETFDGRSKAWSVCDVPQRLVTALHRAQNFKKLPILKGLARQPYFRSDGSLVTAAGYDCESGEYALFDAAAFTLAEPTRENAEIALDALRSLVVECHFDTPSDKSAALCAMLTATVRGSLPLSPAFNISASASGSGKSYLAQVIGKFAGNGEPFNASYPTSADEATKTLLAVGLRRPAVLCFDDMTNDWVAHGPINRFLTSQTITDRMLGTNRMASVSTRVLMLGTGNNVRPKMDLQRRVASIYLNPAIETPSMIAYKDNPYARLNEHRGRFVGHALTIVRAYLGSGELVTECLPIGSYGEWSRMCREPLIWLGEPDPATSLIEQVKDDPDTAALGEILKAMHQMFGSKAVPIRELIPRLQGDEISDVLDELPIHERGEISPSKFGWYLKKHVNRTVGGYQLLRAPTSSRTAWAVMRTGAAAEDPAPRPKPAVPVTTIQSGYRPAAAPDDDVY